MSHRPLTCIMKLFLSPTNACMILLAALLLLSPCHAEDEEDALPHLRGYSRDLGSSNNNAMCSKMTIAVFGDWPYSQSLLDNKDGLINSINGDGSVQAVMHLGDIHSGSMPCTGYGLQYKAGGLFEGSTAVSASNQVINPRWNIDVFNAFQQFQSPLVYTPGDNEWADCHKSKQLSSGSPLKELEGVRKLFFSKPGYTLGVQKLVVSQALSYDPAYPDDAAFVENVMWRDQCTHVVFATFNFPGGSNDDTSQWTAPFTNDIEQLDERTKREAANLRWLDAAFDMAAQQGTKAIVIATQADMWDTEKVASIGLDKYTPFVQKLASRSLAFAKPVLVVNGDSHVFKADQPLVPSGIAGPLVDGCVPGVTCDISLIHNTPEVPNLRRIVVWGSNDAQKWLKLTIDKTEPSIFSWVNVAYT